MRGKAAIIKSIFEDLRERRRHLRVFPWNGIGARPRGFPSAPHAVAVSSIHPGTQKTYTLIYTHARTHTHTHTHTYTHTYVHTHTHTHTRTHIHTYIHTHIYMHTQTQAHAH